MVEPALTKTSPPVETVSYRPITLLAVLGLACSILFISVALVTAVVSWRQGTPAFLSRFFLAIPAAGFVLCLLALRRIQLSEGTLSGDRLAKWGLWLSTVGLLGYCAYEFGINMAIQQQANSFLTVIDKNAPNDSGFFAHIQAGDLNRAYLLTRKYSNRSGVNPSDSIQMRRFDFAQGKDPKGPLTKFTENELIYLLQSTDNKPVPQGIHSWDYQEGGFVVERVYSLATPEMDAEFLIKIQSTDSTVAGVERKWYVVWPPRILETTRFTKLGANLRELRQYSEQYFATLSDRLNSKAALPSLPKDKTNWNAVDVLNTEEIREPLRKAVTRFFENKGPPLRQMLPASGKLYPWKRDKDGHLMFTHSFVLMLDLTPPGSKDAARYSAQGKLFIRSKIPVDPEKLSSNPGWEAVSYEIEKLRPAPKIELSPAQAPPPPQS